MVRQTDSGAERTALSEALIKESKNLKSFAMNSTVGSKLIIDATTKLPGEGFKRPWPPLIKTDEAVKARVAKIFNL